VKLPHKILEVKIRRPNNSVETESLL
jgi:hypothetical protein